MKLKAKTHIGCLGEVTCVVRHKDGTETVYPTEQNTHTYTWFNWATSNNTLSQFSNPFAPTAIDYCYVGTGNTPITKTSTRLQTPLSAVASGTIGTFINDQDIGGILYSGVENQYIFTFGVINATITEIGLHKTPGNTSGLHCGLVLNTPVIVTSEDQLIVRYKRLYSGNCIGWLASDLAGWNAMPNSDSGSFVYAGNTYNYTLKVAHLIKGGSIAAPTSIQTMGGGASTVFIWDGTASTTGGTTVTSPTITHTLLTPNTTQRDFVSYSTSLLIPPTSGTYPIGRLGFGGPTGSVYWAITMLLSFDPPLPKTNQLKFQVTIEHTISWS